MCNLSEAIYQEGIERGRAEGRTEGKAEGRTEGKAEGKAEGKVEVLLEAYRSGLISAKDAAGLLGMTEEQFTALKGR